MCLSYLSLSYRHYFPLYFSYFSSILFIVLFRIDFRRTFSLLLLISSFGIPLFPCFPLSPFLLSLYYFFHLISFFLPFTPPLSLFLYPFLHSFCLLSSYFLLLVFVIPSFFFYLSVPAPSSSSHFFPLHLLSIIIFYLPYIFPSSPYSLHHFFSFSVSPSSS